VHTLISRRFIDVRASHVFLDARIPDDASRGRVRLTTSLSSGFGALERDGVQRIGALGLERTIRGRAVVTR
jgi:hypothetical protein